MRDRGRGAALELSATHVERLADEPGRPRVAWAARAQAARVSRTDRDGAGDGEPVARAALRGIVVGDRRGRPARTRRTLACGRHLPRAQRAAACTSRWSRGSRSRCCAGWSPASPFGGRVAAGALGGAAGPRARDRVHAGHRRAARDAARADRRRARARRARCSIARSRLVDALGVAAIAILAWRPAGPVRSVVPAVVRRGARRSRSEPAPDRRARCRALARARTRDVGVGHRSRPRRSRPVTSTRSRAGGVVGNLVLTPLVELVALPLALAGARRSTWDCADRDSRRVLVARVDRRAPGCSRPCMPVGRGRDRECARCSRSLVALDARGSRPRAAVARRRARLGRAVRRVVARAASAAPTARCA